MFRGYGRGYQLKNSWAPRTHPKDMSPWNHRELNEAFEKKYGHPFRNSLFTVGNYTTAEPYGSAVFIIVPIGKFDWLCNTSEKLCDLFE